MFAFRISRLPSMSSSSSCWCVPWLLPLPRPSHPRRRTRTRSDPPRPASARQTANSCADIRDTLRGRATTRECTTCERRGRTARSETDQRAATVESCRGKWRSGAFRWILCRAVCVCVTRREMEQNRSTEYVNSSYLYDEKVLHKEPPIVFTHTSPPLKGLHGHGPGGNPAGFVDFFSEFGAPTGNRAKKDTDAGDEEEEHDERKQVAGAIFVRKGTVEATTEHQGICLLLLINKNRCVAPNTETRSSSRKNVGIRKLDACAQIIGRRPSGATKHTTRPAKTQWLPAGTPRQDDKTLKTAP